MSIRKFSSVIGLGFLLISLRLYQLQIIQGNKFYQLSKANSIRIIALKGARGKILDRKGEVIVDNQFSYELMAYPQAIENVDDFLKKLASVLGISFSSLKKTYQAQAIQSSLPITLVKDLDKEKAIILEELKSEFPQIVIQSVPKRFYPYGRLASHIIGYIGLIDRWRLDKWKDYGYSIQDTVGYGGIEERYDYYLKPDNGGIQLEIDSYGRLRRILGFKKPINGKDITLTIDLRVQKIVEEVLKDYSGAVVIIQPHTGEIIALASSPNFSPFEISNPSVLKDLLSDPTSPLVNRAISGLYPPGSVFKVVVADSALENKRIDEKTTFFCDGSLKIGNRQFGCWEKHGNQNLFWAIVHSCDIFFYKVGLSLGADKINEYALKFGLGKLTHIDLPEEKAGFVPHPLLRKLEKRQAWFDGDTANFAIGQGELLTTPLQIVRMISVFANGGKLVRPYIVKAIAGKDISLKQRKILSLGIPEKFLKIINRAMEAVVKDPEGTAHLLYIPDLSIAGKTGTAQVSKKQPHAWFAGFFPVENPSYSICVILEHAGSSTNACLVTKKIIERMKEEGIL